MSINLFIRILSQLFCPFALASPPERTRAADMILLNGPIYTMRKPLEKVDAVAIKGQSIIAVGDSKSVVAHQSKYTKIIDLHGKTVLPGFIESHGHLAFMGMVSQRIKISKLKSEMEVADLVRAQAKNLKPGEWLLSQGWDQAKWGQTDFPTYRSITDAAPNNPVLLMRVDGHTAWINKKAMEIAGINRNTPNPKGGEILKDRNGDPTGILIDTAQELVSQKIPEPTVDQIAKSIDIAINEALRNGVTTFEDMMTSKEAFLVLKEMAGKRRLKIRIYAAHGDLRADMFFREKKWTEEVLKKYRPLVGFGGGFLTARAIKILADGSLGGRGAALLEPYSDKPTTGLLMKTAAEIARTVSLAMKKGYQVATHAIGDRANHEVLNGYEQAIAENPQVVDPRLRIEHTQVILPSDIPRMSRSKIIASMQPNHCTADLEWIEQRLGAKRAGEEAFLWNSILSAGTPMAFGSDAPFGELSPLRNVYAAITRQREEDGYPPGGWHPEQGLNLFQSIRMYTADAAFAVFEEKSKGLIEKGKLADLAILSQDPFEISALEILNTRIDMTIVGGEIVYRSADDK